MYLLVKRNGHKYWRLDYRFRGKRKTLALGVYPQVGLKDAREKRRQAKACLSNDQDPGVNGGAKLVHPGGAKLVHLTLCGTQCWGVVPVVHRRDPRCFV